MRFDWIYAKLIDGWLIDVETGKPVGNFPILFKNEEEANKYVKDNDLRITIVKG